MDTVFHHTMVAEMARDWWIILVRGVAAVVFGILAFVLPGLTLFALVLLFGIYALVDGITSLARAVSAGRHGESWIWPTLGGVISIAAAIVAFTWPGETALILLYIIAAWAILTGISEIIAGIGLRRELSGEWLLILGGAVSVLFGVLVFARPGAGALAVVWLIGFYAVVLGLQRIALAFRVREIGEHPMATSSGHMPPAAA